MHHPMPSNSTAALSLRIAGARLAHRLRGANRRALVGFFFWAGVHEKNHGA
jgi:hypothetical protein